MNYDELDIPSYDDSNDSINSKNKAFDSGDLGKLIDDTCVGSACCPEGYTYDSATNRCSNSIPSPSPSIAATSPSTSGSSFTTLEYEQVESAYTDKSFNSEDLIRAPNAQNVAPLREVTSLNYSTF